jgi:hypothetical protein
MDGLGTQGSDAEDTAERRWFDNRVERLIVVDAALL